MPFTNALQSLEVALGQHPEAVYRHNHLFMNILCPTRISPAEVEKLMRFFTRRYSNKLRRLSVTHVEMRVLIWQPANDTSLSSASTSAAANEVLVAYRFVASNPTGHVLHVAIYRETQQGASSAVTIFRRINSRRSPFTFGDEDWDGQDIDQPYSTAQPYLRQRAAAAATDTVWIYDTLELVHTALQQQWRQAIARQPALTLPSQQLLEAVELVVDETGKALKQVVREPGLNDVGMVAWHLTLRTPEYPEGRPVVLIGNDIAHQAGSFGVREDMVFALASAYARGLGVPRLYWAANSGARLGLADEVQSRFRVAWTNEADPAKGFQYLYLTEADYQQLSATKSVRCEAVTVPQTGETRYVLTDIIGAKDGLGVENLQGSAAIAGETSRAYRETFTLSYVSGRTVGIGAYLVRLGQRVIQKRDAPIILTGFQALNKVLGKPLYASNNQLGGIDIMFSNGISHQVVEDDFQGALAVLHWLAFVPSHRDAPIALPRLVDSDEDSKTDAQNSASSSLHVLTPSADSPVRGIDLEPLKKDRDVRELLAGCFESAAPLPFASSSRWLSGFFDAHSFTEYERGWAPTVVVARARLGGIPMGVIAVETRSVEVLNPADPASTDSKEGVTSQAGQVWYPDSAYKTAQAIRDFSGERLPLMIFANWRGFSGGMRDMFDAVLKFGSMIVDALTEYDQPVFIYIPPRAELRGGAWVVVDPAIGPDTMEMYADPQSRGGILEPEGLVDVKFRRPDLLASARRWDATLVSLDAEVAAIDARIAQVRGTATAEVTLPGLQAERAQAVARVQKREAALYPVFHQVAVAFGDLHDTAGRMQAKGVIREVLPWQRARAYFFWRVQYRLLETQCIRKLREAQLVETPKAGAAPGGLLRAGRALLREWLLSAHNGDSAVVDRLQGDEGTAELVRWWRRHLDGFDAWLESQRVEAVQSQLRALAQRHGQGHLLQALRALLSPADLASLSS